MADKSEGRQLWVDYLKTMACVAVLVFHVIYGLQNAGIYTHTYLNVIKDFCDIFQIPLFMMASGYLYGCGKNVTSYFEFEKKKLINLAVPYFVFSIIYFLINTIFASSVNFSYGIDTLFKLPLYPIAQYWFLYALILIFLLVPALELIIKNEYIIFAIFLVWKILAINMFILGVVDYYIAGYAVFFYFGVVYARKKEIFKPLKGVVVYIMTGVFLIMFGILEIYTIENQRMLDIYKLVVNMLVILMFMILFEKHARECKNKLVNLISRYSFQIYLLHTMATSAVRIILGKIGIYNDLIHVIIGIVAGLTFSIVVGIICEKSVLLNILFYPYSTIRKIKKGTN